MYGNDPGEIRGLEEIFRSRQFGRTSDSAGAGPEAVARSAAREESVFKSEFGGGRCVPAPVPRGSEAGEGAGPSIRPADAAVSADTPPPRSAEPELAGALVGVAHAGEGAVSSSGRPKRETNTYRAIAALSAVAALVAAGVTSGAGQHRPPSVSAQGPRSPARPTRSPARPVRQQRTPPRPGRGGSVGGAVPGEIVGFVGSGQRTRRARDAHRGRDDERPGRRPPRRRRRPVGRRRARAGPRASHHLPEEATRRRRPRPASEARWLRRARRSRPSPTKLAARFRARRR